MMLTVRRAEPKQLLAHMNQLQMTFRQDRGSFYYYNNDENKDGSGNRIVNSGLSKLNKYGQAGSTGKSVSCNPNRLNFSTIDCKDIRYWYWVVRGDEHGYIGVAILDIRMALTSFTLVAAKRCKTRSGGCMGKR